MGNGTSAIVKDNKTIAIFMGGKTSDMSRFVSGYQNIWLPIHGVCNWATVDIGNGKTLKYHKSWDWLMPVFNKIQATRDQYTYYHGSVFYDAIVDAVCSVDINAAYASCVEFINWWNTFHIQHADAIGGND